MDVQKYERRWTDIRRRTFEHDEYDDEVSCYLISEVLFDDQCK